MTREPQSSPPPRGAGAGGGGHSNTPPPEKRAQKLGHGWSPDSEGAARQKDRVRTNLRAKRLRAEMTPSEEVLQKLLRTVEGAHFRKQVAVGDYVFDFGWLSARVLIEIDGGVHDLPDVQANDKAKEIFAITQGFRVLRLQNRDVRERPVWVVEHVREAIARRASVRPPPPAPPHKGAGSE